VAHALQRLNAQRTLSRISILNHGEASANIYGRDSVLSGRAPSSMNPYSAGMSINHFGLANKLSRQIENPITSLQEYCKANMLPIDIKAEECQPDPTNPDQQRL
jgi:hypothetical protein